jgi:hypothetical protein
VFFFKIRFVFWRVFATLGVMAQQVLGRNLEVLLNVGAKKAGDSFAPVTAPVSAPAGPGVRSLMRGQQADAATGKAAVPRWYLFGGDILLAALALIIVCTSPHPLTWRKELFCAAAVALGGCLAVGAVWRAEEQ